MFSELPTDFSEGWSFDLVGADSVASTFSPNGRYQFARGIGALPMRNGSMDVSALTSVATQMSQLQLGDAVQSAVLKKTMDIEKQVGLQMLEALEQSAPRNPPHLGNTIDVQV